MVPVIFGFSYQIPCRTGQESIATSCSGAGTARRPVHKQLIASNSSAWLIRAALTGGIPGLTTSLGRGVEV